MVRSTHQVRRRAGAAGRPADRAFRALAIWSGARPRDADRKLVAQLTRSLCAWLRSGDQASSQIASLLDCGRTMRSRYAIFRAAAHVACHEVCGREPDALAAALTRLDALESSVFPPGAGVFPLGHERGT